VVLNMMATFNPKAPEDAQRFSGGFDDMQDDDLGAAAPAAGAPAAPRKVYVEQCGKCHGTGRYHGPSSRGSDCFECHGQGNHTYTTSPEQRAAARERAAAKKQALLDAKWLKWAALHENEAGWILANMESNDFARAMRIAAGKWGSLTDGQLRGVHRWMLTDEDRAAERMRAELTAKPVNTVNLGAVETAFNRAKSQGIKWPKLTLDGFTISMAGAASKNPGAIYVKQGARDGTYLGKVLNAGFQRSRDCDDATEAAVLAAMADPLASAVAYGKKFGRCAVCHRELSDPESIARGIGPICQDRLFGG
jgi:hypothetical protein